MRSPFYYAASAHSVPNAKKGERTEGLEENSIKPGEVAVSDWLKGWHVDSLLPSCGSSSCLCRRWQLVCLSSVLAPAMTFDSYLRLRWSTNNRIKELLFFQKKKRKLIWVQQKKRSNRVWYLERNVEPIGAGHTEMLLIKSVVVFDLLFFWPDWFSPEVLLAKRECVLT